METALLEHPTSSCEPEACDTFQFMANHLGVRVLHPGGLAATAALAERCGVSAGMTILDAGCGAGSSSVFLARRFGCKVVGVDSDQGLLLKAQGAARKAGVLDRVAFRRGDLHAMPFEDGTFDGAIAQAVLIFTDKRRALREITREVRRGGFFGSVELTWRRAPTEEVSGRVRTTLCSVAANAEPLEGWVRLLGESGLTAIEAETRDLDFSFRGMLENEGLLRALRIAGRSLLEGSTRRKTQELTRLFREIRQDLGYGMYVGRRPDPD
jgi:ubiquinone/menaquinone biosynthesis C-methylase UbiE